ncbi:MAG: porin family protein [Alphaproteobacteria bacterium]|nr:porin family protein [Alphaproteobacteria bacterium]
MKKHLPSLAAALLLATSGSALAADLTTKKAPPAPLPTPMWKGFYVGLNAGGIWSNSSSANMTTYPIWQTLATTPANTPYYSSLNGSLNIGSTSGFIGGGQVGYNWQPGYLNNNLVFGFEADIQGVVSTGKTNRNFNSISPLSNGGSLLNSINANGNMDFFGTVRGRLGYLVMPTLLVYGTGGLAYGNVSYSVNLAQYGMNSAGNASQIALGSAYYSNVQVGWTAGGGAEWMFMPNWSAKAEYLYYDLGGNNLEVNTVAYSLGSGAVVSSSSAFYTASNISGHPTGNLVRAGVNYHMNLSPSAIVAKY